MSEEYYIGQIFNEEYPPEAAVWCNQTHNTDNPALIFEIEPTEEGIKRFQIQAVSPSEEDTKQARINELQRYLDDTDWYCSRYVDIGTPIPDDIKQQRSDARIEIDRLRHELEPSEDTESDTDTDTDTDPESIKLEAEHLVDLPEAETD